MSRTVIGAIIVLLLLAFLWFTGSLQNFLGSKGTQTGTSGQGAGSPNGAGSTNPSQSGTGTGSQGGAGGAGGTGGSNQILPNVSIPPVPSVIPTAIPSVPKLP
ncbi:MAG TPA: hypothetical protein VKC89_03465 [Patescibacteria group bacterium]|nr:hypothetical protein [Patescibacteria group bacterium]